MTSPVLFVVDDDAGSLGTLDGTLRRRYERDYLVIAVDEVDETQWLNADYLDGFRPRATRVVLGDGEKRALELEVVR